MMTIGVNLPLQGNGNVLIHRKCHFTPFYAKPIRILNLDYLIGNVGRSDQVNDNIFSRIPKEQHDIACYSIFVKSKIPTCVIKRKKVQKAKLFIQMIEKEDQSVSFDKTKELPASHDSHR